MPGRKWFSAGAQTQTESTEKGRLVVHSEETGFVSRSDAKVLYNRMRGMLHVDDFRVEGNVL